MFWELFGSQSFQKSVAIATNESGALLGGGSCSGVVPLVRKGLDMSLNSLGFAFSLAAPWARDLALRAVYGIPN